MRSGGINSMGGPFDLTGLGETFFGELFSGLGDSSPEAAMAMALVSKGRVKLSTSAKALNGLAKTAKAVHGNSLKSLKPTWGYKLYDKSGKFLKNGITNKAIPTKRYTRAFMEDKKMIPYRQFENRLQAWDWEYGQNWILRGTLNKNMH